MHERPLEHRPHPRHGIDPGERFPDIVRAYIEIVPTDGVKYEIDKHSGYLMVDRPHRFSSFCPTLYGFVPRTYCGDRVAAYALKGGPPVSRGDGIETKLRAALLAGWGLQRHQRAPSKKPSRSEGDLVGHYGRCRRKLVLRGPQRRSATFRAQRGARAGTMSVKGRARFPYAEPVPLAEPRRIPDRWR